MSSTLPDPDEFAEYLRQAGFNILDAQMNEATEVIAQVITKGGELKKHARAAGFSEGVAEEIAVAFIDRMVSGGTE
ncbi:hypothetical protein [Streptomyces sp. NPDC048057]|uniref:hypothetical protein n=1 Tax=Streptomyces sp. NPDC048057 TaxID=3155628 RepID=UPI0033C2878D